MSEVPASSLNQFGTVLAQNFNCGVGFGGSTATSIDRENVIIENNQKSAQLNVSEFVLKNKSTGQTAYLSENNIQFGGSTGQRESFFGVDSETPYMGLYKGLSVLEADFDNSNPPNPRLVMKNGPKEIEINTDLQSENGMRIKNGSLEAKLVINQPGFSPVLQLLKSPNDATLNPSLFKMSSSSSMGPINTDECTSITSKKVEIRKEISNTMDLTTEKSQISIDVLDEPLLTMKRPSGCRVQIYTCDSPSCISLYARGIDANNTVIWTQLLGGPGGCSVPA